ncbi:MAG: NADH-quinone oxidoreductase subunit J [Pseudomonadota bacterium]|nr:NADH-quinone oxidoreductase subunit J [Pseudomonadota bacterium]
MNFLQFTFYLFSVILIISAALVVTVKNPVKAALFLVLAFFSAACIWITLEVEFLAIALVLVYVGAVMVLFLFVVMMLDIDIARLREGFTQYLPVGLVVAGVMVTELAVVMLSGRFGLDAVPRPSAHAADYSNTRELGLKLYTDYVYAFEIAALILLVAIIAAISLTFRRRRDSNVQTIAEQVRVRKADRLRIIKMPAERDRGVGD